MSSSNFKHELFTQFAVVGKALSNGNRLELLEFLAQGERSVEDLATVSGLTVANTSRVRGLITVEVLSISLLTHNCRLRPSAHI